MKYGVATARRGWIEKKDVINALPLEQFLAALRPKPAATPAAPTTNAAKKKVGIASHDLWNIFGLPCVFHNASRQRASSLDTSMFDGVTRMKRKSWMTAGIAGGRNFDRQPRLQPAHADEWSKIL